MTELSATPALELQGVAKLYGRTAALRTSSLRVESGEAVALLGPNGSGKTTLLKIIAGAITPTMGGGSIFGKNMLTERHALRNKIGFLASETYLYDDLTAQENLRFILTMAGRRPDAESLHAALETVSLMAHADERVRTFSSGMRRRLALGRMLVLEPRLLLLDEPYNSLDEAGSDLVDTLVRRAARSGHATILATHDAERALSVADKVAVLERGDVTYWGAVAGYRVRHAQHVG